MRMTGRAGGKSAGVAGFLLLMACGQTGVAFQRNPPPNNPSPTYPSNLGNNGNNSSLAGRTTSLDDQSSMRDLEEKRGKAVNTERQRMMIKEANQLVQATADLQASVTKGIEGAGRDEQAKRAEAIEKLARDVKERMKGGR